LAQLLLRSRDLRAINFDQVLSPEERAQDFFRDKIVVVGRRDDPSDIFQTPHSRFASGLISSGYDSPGAAIHAMKLLNLVRGDWLTRLGMLPEMAIVILWGILITTLLMLLRPWPAICAALALGFLFAGICILLTLQKHVWFPGPSPFSPKLLSL